MAAVVSAAGIASSMAQVYSANVVGYVNLTIPEGYSMIANQLNASPTNTIANVIPTAPGGTQVFKWDSVNQQLFNAIEYVEGSGWFNADETPSEEPLPPGTGFYIYNQSGAPFTLTLVGEVPQGTFPVSMGTGYSMVALSTPQSVGFSTVSFPQVGGTQYFEFDPTTQGLKDAIEYVEGTGWFTVDEQVVDPTPAIGQGFFIYNQSGSTINWSYSFTVN